MKKILTFLFFFIFSYGISQAQVKDLFYWQDHNNSDSIYWQLDADSSDTSVARNFGNYKTCLIDWHTTYNDSIAYKILLQYSLDLFHWYLSDSTIAITDSSYAIDTLHVNYPAPFVRIIARPTTANKKGGLGTRLRMKGFFKDK